MPLLDAGRERVRQWLKFYENVTVYLNFPGHVLFFGGQRFCIQGF